MYRLFGVLITDFFSRKNTHFSQNSSLDAIFENFTKSYTNVYTNKRQDEILVLFQKGVIRH